MPLLDLSLVTATLLRLLRLRVNPLWASLFPPAPPPPSVSYTSAPSANATGEQTLGLFLYHINEDAQFKNQPPYYGDQPPIRFAAMGLQLQYQLYAHASDGDIDSIMTRTQRLFGLGMKTLHDYPSIDRTTQIGPDFVFVPELQGSDNVMRIVLKSVSTNDATNFWNAGTQAVRLAAYYEVGATMLEPDRPVRGRGRVLRYGVQVFVNGAPRFDTSRSTVTFRIPGEAADRTVEVQPGEAATGGNIQFDGTDLNGDATTLLVKRGGWDDPEEVGSDWGVIAGGVLPYAARSAAPPTWTFAVEGVTSISADLHKYGYAPKGTSLLLHRTAAHRRPQYFAYADWPGYTMLNSTIQSTKSGGPLAGAWAVVEFAG